jgi:hypothetical protein
MPFLRPTTMTSPWLRTVTLAVTLAALLATAVPPAHVRAAPDATPGLAQDTVPTRAQAPVAHAATFCPLPTGRWWDDLAVRGCIELLTGRDHTTPMSATELAWLDFGDLPPYAHVDIEAIDATLAAYAQHLAEEATARAEAEAAARDAGTGRTRRTTPTPARTTGGQDQDWHSGSDGFPYDGTLYYDRESAMHEMCLARTPEPGGGAMFGGPEWNAFFRTVAECVDREVPGYLARWLQQEADWAARAEEGRRQQEAAQARLDARVEAAKVEAAATCPGTWTVSYFGWMVSSLDEIEVTITCH